MFKKGFTLIEILLVVAAIAILAGIVILAINPTKQLGETRNARRRADVVTILNAIYQYSIDNNGDIPDGILLSVREICKKNTVDCTGYANLYDLVNEEKYLVDFPVDPSHPSGENGIGYSVNRDSYGRITVYAPLAELDAIISVSR